MGVGLSSSPDSYSLPGKRNRDADPDALMLHLKPEGSTSSLQRGRGVVATSRSAGAMLDSNDFADYYVSLEPAGAEGHVGILAFGAGTGGTSTKEAFCDSVIFATTIVGEGDLSRFHYMSFAAGKIKGLRGHEL